MKIRLLSDTHHEFYRSNKWKSQPWVTNAGEDILILAGDIASGSSNVIDTISEFLNTGIPKIIYVPGNHEYYGTEFSDFNKKITSKSQTIGNLAVLNPGYRIVDRTLFIGTPLFTNFSNRPIAQLHAQQVITDFRLIKNIKPHNYVEMFDLHNKFIFDTINENHTFADTIAVITHWLPSHELISPKYRSDASGLNSYFANELDQQMMLVSSQLQDKKLFWFYGHTHFAGQKNLHGWQCIANPAGYPNEITGDTFDPKLIVEI